MTKDTEGTTDFEALLSEAIATSFTHGAMTTHNHEAGFNAVVYKADAATRALRAAVSKLQASHDELRKVVGAIVALPEFPMQIEDYHTRTLAWLANSCMSWSALERRGLIERTKTPGNNGRAIKVTYAGYLVFQLLQHANLVPLTIIPTWGAARG